MAVVSMIMGKQHSIQPLNVGGQQLLAQVGAGINQNDGAGMLDQN
jgi:hypothetical protein